MKFTLKGTAETRTVWLNGKRLDPKPSLKVYNHSPDGFNWGYGGSGPAQLALAICLKLFKKQLGEKACARMHQDFKWDMIASLPEREDFEKELEWEPKRDYQKL